MLDNKTLKAKLKKELKSINLKERDEEILVGELNYLSNLLIDIYIRETKNDKRKTANCK
jgi:hypothetical protein